jgi:hypothetical protein
VPLRFLDVNYWKNVISKFLHIPLFEKHFFRPYLSSRQSSSVS